MHITLIVDRMVVVGQHPAHEPTRIGSVCLRKYFTFADLVVNLGTFVLADKYDKGGPRFGPCNSFVLPKRTHGIIFESCFDICKSWERIEGKTRINFCTTIFTGKPLKVRFLEMTANILESVQSFVRRFLRNRFELQNSIELKIE